MRLARNVARFLARFHPFLSAWAERDGVRRRDHGLSFSASRLSRDREVVIPAKAGIQNFLERRELSNWIPAFAGMTGKVLIPKVSRLKWEASFSRVR